MRLWAEDDFSRSLQVVLEAWLPFGLFETVCQKLNDLAIWPYFSLFYIDKNSIFLDLFWTNLSKFKTLYEILNFNSVILTKKIGLYLAFFHFSGFGLF